MDITDKRDEWSKAYFAGQSDYEVAQAGFYNDAYVIEHDAYCCCDEGCPDAIVEARKLVDAANYEGARRERTGEQVSKDTDPNIERDLAPFGPEWELEQRERMENR